MSHDTANQRQHHRVRLSAELTRLRELNQLRRRLQIFKKRAQNRGMSGLLWTVLLQLQNLWKTEEESRRIVIDLFFKLNPCSMIGAAKYTAYRLGRSGAGSADDAVQQAVEAFISNTDLDFSRIREPITPETCEDRLRAFLQLKALDLAREAGKKEKRHRDLLVSNGRDFERQPLSGLDLINAPAERVNRMLLAAPRGDATRLARIYREFRVSNATRVISKADRRWLRRLPTKRWFPR